VINLERSGHLFAVQVAEHPAAVPEQAACARSQADEGRLTRVVSEHFDVLWRFLRRLGIPEADVDDAVQEVILVLARKLEHVHPGAERSFVLNIALRVASGMRRQAKRRNEVDESSLADMPSQAPDPEASADSARLRVLLNRVLRALPVELSAVLVLYELEDFTMAEIARALDLPPGTVASRLRRARATFEALATDVLRADGAA